MGFSFLYPLALAGLITASLPLLIHLLNRRQQKRIRFPAVKFVLLSQKRVARTYNLRNWLLLAVRTLAVILLVLLMANPLFQTGVGLFARGAPLITAVVLDNSQSMAIADDGLAFEQAKKAAHTILGALDDDDRAVLIPTNPVKANNLSLRDPQEVALKDLGSLQATAGTADFVASLGTAYQLLRDTGGQKALWVITDLGLTGWDKLSLATVGEYDPTVPLRIVTVGGQNANFNATIKSLEAKKSGVATGLELELVATLINFTNAGINDLPVRLTIDDKVRAERLVRLPPRGEAKVSFQFKLDQPGSHAGHVSLGREGIAGNQQHYFTIETQDRLNILLVDGDPQRSLVDSETFFLSRALNPTEELNDSVLLPEVIIGGALSDASPDAYQGVVLANLPTIPERFVPKLLSFVQQGGGLLLSLGDQVQTGDYNRKLGNSGIGVLPVMLGEPQRVQLNQEVSIDRIDTEHPALSPLRNKLLADSLRSAKVQSYFKVAPGRGRVLLHLSNGDPLLIEQKLGKGRILLLTSTADSAWNNIPLKTAYLPLMQSLIKYMAGGTDGTIDTGVAAGTAKHFLAPAAHAGKHLRVIDPFRSEQEITLKGQEEAATATYAHNDYAGIYRVVTEDRGLGLPTLYAVNAPPLESRLERISQDDLERKLNPVTHEIIGHEDLSLGGTRTDLSLALVVILTLLLLFEGWLGQRNYE